MLKKKLKISWQNNMALRSFQYHKKKILQKFHQYTRNTIKKIHCICKVDLLVAY